MADKKIASRTIRKATAVGRVGIVIPCFNEECRLDRAAFVRFLETHDAGVEFFLVNDGSSDRTLDVLLDLQRQFPRRIHVIDQQPNQGKAEAVRAGMQRALAAGVDYAGYLDADLATPLEAIGDFVHVLDANPDIHFVIGARVALLGRTIERKATRHYLGRVFATVASLVLSLPVYDTQCGAKLLRAGRRVNGLFDEPFGSRWIFDVELIARYLTHGGTSDGLYELPLLRWRDVAESKVKGRDFVRAIGEIADIYRTYFLSRRQNRLLALWSAPLLRYVAVGGIGTSLHYALLAALVEFWQVHPGSAALAGSIVGATVNYILNYHLTFTSKSSHARTFLKFAIVAMLSASLNGSGMWLLTESFHLHYLAAQVFCTFGVLGFGYILNRAWTFGHPGLPAESEPDEQPLTSTPSESLGPSAVGLAQSAMGATAFLSRQ